MDNSDFSKHSTAQLKLRIKRQLISFLGENGPRQLRIRKDAKVVEASRNGDWLLPAASSENAQALMVALTDVTAPTESNGRDRFLWRKATGTYHSSFPSHDTWEQLRSRFPRIPWASVVWFKEHVPRFSFCTWLSMLSRLPTRDRLRRWGMNIPASCVLCSTGIESHHHLFFERSYSVDVWGYMAEIILPNPPTNLPAVSTWIINQNSPHQSKVATILKLLLQSVVYHLWKERNRRVFSVVTSIPATLHLTIDRTIRDRLLSLPDPSQQASLLLIYFSFFSYRL